MKKVYCVIKKVLQIVLCVFIVILLVFNVATMVQRAQGKQMPVVFGFSFAVVVSGSMEPEIKINDVVIVKSQKNYKERDIITFCDTLTGDYVTHRIILASEDGTFLTKGDANNTDDKLAIPKEAVVGKVIAVLPGAGNIIRKMQTPLGMLIMVGGSLAFWVVLELIDKFCINSQNNNEKSTEQKHGD